MKIALVVAAAVALVLPVGAHGAPPASDDFDAARVVSTLPFLENVDATEATSAADDPADCGAGPSVWYRFTPATDMSVQVETYGSDYDTLVSAYTGTRGALTIVDPIVGCSFSQSQPRVFLDLTAGTTYYFLVNTFPGRAGGPLSFGVWDLSRPAANDLLEDAVQIESLPFKDTADNTGATSGPGEPTCEGASGATVWYSFTPGADVRIYATSQFFVTSETFIAVYSGTPGSLAQIACGIFPPQVQWDARAGQTYYLQIGTYGALGVFNLLVHPAFRITALDANRTARVHKRVVTVSGVVSCNYRTGFVMLSGSVTQGSSFGEFSAEPISCPRSGVASWSATTSSATRRQFQPGSARIDVFATGQYGTSTDERSTSRAIVIKPDE